MVKTERLIFARNSSKDLPQESNRARQVEMQRTHTQIIRTSYTLAAQSQIIRRILTR